ncbi:MAG TPA: hypothetical protein VFA71_06195 [Terriglobales bacterium]|nr:hypothetical protein [Terriglobales bacterium]
MTTASAGSVFTCMQVGERYFMGPLRGNIGRASYDFNIEIYDGFKGPGPTSLERKSRRQRRCIANCSYGSHSA